MTGTDDPKGILKEASASKPPSAPQALPDPTEGGTQKGKPMVVPGPSLAVKGGRTHRDPGTGPMEKAGAWTPGPWSRSWGKGGVG